MREAQEVVAHADSLREAHLYAQNEYDDSLSLAQAYETLKEIPLPFRGWLGLNSSYAHACYHYGRLLRAKGNYVEAMKVFIDATHSRTRDYRILGRIYNNMGDMAHLAGDYALSYDMFAISADYFLQNGDTINYYYGLNDMAFELAEQGKKEETLVLLDSITRNCNDKNVILKTWETKAEMYREISQYDSAIVIVDSMLRSGYNQSIGYVIKAQSFDKLGILDSSLYFAKYVLEMPHASTNDKYNMLYITSHYDSTLTSEDILTQTSNRADIGMMIDKRHAQHAQACEILRYDLSREHWQIWVIIGSIILLICISYYGIRQTHKRKSDMVEITNKQIEKNIQSIKAHIDMEDIYTSLSWKDYKAMKTKVDLYLNGLVSKLETHHLNETEIRFCVLTLLGLPLKKIADIICYSYPSGIKTLKKRIADKLETNSPNLRDFLLRL